MNTASPSNTVHAKVLLATAATLTAASAVQHAHADEFFINDGEVFSLKDAIIAANGNGEPDTIHLAEDGLYTIVAPHDTVGGGIALPEIESDITIEGNGATIERSSEPGTDPFRFFLLPSGSDAELTLNDLTLLTAFALEMEILEKGHNRCFPISLARPI